jgi:hypothetical protein
MEWSSNAGVEKRRQTSIARRAAGEAGKSASMLMRYA